MNLSKTQPTYKNSPTTIGIFDSGVGGLTVFKEVQARLPHVNIIYFADSGRSPYGELPLETLLEYGKEGCHFLEELGVTSILLACHTLATTHGAHLKTLFSTPIFSIAEASLPLLASFSQIALMGTSATIRSCYYQNYLDQRLSLAFSCPTLVPMIEKGHIDIEIISQSLKPITDSAKPPCDALFLACTHYPLLSPILQSLVDPLPLINPASALVQMLPSAPLSPSSSIHFFTTGDPAQFHNLSQKLLKQVLPPPTALSFSVH